MTKFGTKGVVNLVKLVPIAGGVIGGAIDIGSTKMIAQNAFNVFIKNQIPTRSDDLNEVMDDEV